MADDLRERARRMFYPQQLAETFYEKLADEFAAIRAEAKAEGLAEGRKIAAERKTLSIFPLTPEQQAAIDAYDGPEISGSMMSAAAERAKPAASDLERARALLADDPDDMDEYWLAAIIANARREDEIARWQPIETAPRDGTPVLLWRGARGPASRRFRYVAAYWDGLRWCGSGLSQPGDLTFTHWRPLPKPPGREG